MLESLIIIIIIAVSLGLILARLGINPVLAYFTAGTIGSYINVSFQGSIFDLARTLAINVLAFEIGVSFDRRTLDKYFLRGLFILLIEIIFSLNIGLIIGSILGLDLLKSFLLSLIGVNTSTALVYKFSEGRIDEEDRKLMVAVTSLEDIVVFLGILIILSTSTISIESILSIGLSSLAIVVLGFIISRILIKPSTKYTDDLIILASVGSIIIFNLISNQISFPATFGSLLLGFSTSIALEDTSRVLYILRPLRDFMLIFFFIYAGSLIKIDNTILLSLPIAFILVINKFFAFSFGSWLSGIDFVRAFRNGVYMTSISEIGIIISLLAIERGIDIGIVYPIALLTTTIGVFTTSLLLRNENSILKFILKFENKVPKINKLLRTSFIITTNYSNNRSIKISRIFQLILAIISIISAGIVSLQITYQNSPTLFPFIAPFIGVSIPLIILPLVYEIYRSIRNERNKMFVLFVILLLYTYTILIVEDIVFRYYRPISYTEYIILFSAVILAVLFYRRLVRLGREIGRIFSSS